MSLNATFQPLGSTVLVGVTATQAPLAATSGGPSAWRVRCLVTGYLTWGGAGIASNTGPTAGVPVANTIGMTAGGIETFTFPPQSFFISSNAGGFEMTPGEGM